jgi:hypothetical protein
MVNNPTSLAIQAAIDNNWLEAVELNLKIIKQHPKDVDAWLRLAKAYDENGRLILSTRAYHQVLKFDKFNAIAKRGLARLQMLKRQKAAKRSGPQAILKSNLFLEEQGKTKTISLISLTSPQTLLNLKVAQEVQLAAGKHSISVKDKQNRYLGRIPDDLSQRLSKLIYSGNQYLTVVKEVDSKILQIFIKEIKRSNRNDGIPSFPSINEQYHTFLPEEAIKEEE